MSGKRFGIACLGLLAVFLVGCKASDDDSSGGGSGNVDTGGGDQEVTLELGSNSGGSFLSGQVDIDVTSLSAGGTTEITVNLVNAANGNLIYVGGEQTYTFDSQCAGAATPLASFSEVQITNSIGTATTYYTAEGCVGSDTITVKIDDTSVSAATGTVTVAAPSVGSINFVSTSPSTIAIRGFGTATLPETTEVSFKVNDEQGNPIANKDVDFSLTNTLGGVSLATSTTKTNNEGVAKAVVGSGSVNTTFRVIGSTEITTGGSIISTSSSTVSINTGLPTAEYFSLATDTFNPLGWQYINTEVDLVVTASDFHGGPVANNTVISFVARGGQVQTSGGEIASCLIQEGDCTIKWESGPGYPGINDSLGTPGRGIAIILAHTVGEDTFIDENGNSLYDDGETFTSSPEPYIDSDLNGTYTTGEFFLDTDNDGEWDDVPASPKFKGTSCTDAAKAEDHCAELATLFSTTQMVMATDGVDITPATTDVDVSSNTETVAINISDLNGNVPAIDTQVSFSCLGDAKIQGSKPATVPNAYGTAGFGWTAIIETGDDDPDNTPDENDICYVEVETVLGNYYSHPITVTY